MFKLNYNIQKRVQTSSLYSLNDYHQLNLCEQKKTKHGHHLRNPPQHCLTPPNQYLILYSPKVTILTSKTSLVLTLFKRIYALNVMLLSCSLFITITYSIPIYMNVFIYPFYFDWYLNYFQFRVITNIVTRKILVKCLLAYRDAVLLFPIFFFKSIYFSPSYSWKLPLLQASTSTWNHQSFQFQPLWKVCTVVFHHDFNFLSGD